MKDIINIFLTKIFRRCWLIVPLLLLLWSNGEAQQVKVLPSDGSISQESSPQGGLRFQRHFYLITPDELSTSELLTDSMINSIGFTMAAAQDDTTRGSFKVYLQNTTDTESRTDTTWTMVAVATNRLDTTGLVLGDYEWQVQTVCSSDTSDYTGLATFATADTSDCNRPDNLTTTDIGETTATFNWTAPFSSGFTNFLVEHKITDNENWISNNTTDTFFMASGLVSDTSYQWRVSTICTGGDSPETGTNFITNPPDACNEPTGLTNGITTDTSVNLSWTTAAGANYYLIQYRRSGTAPWFFTISLPDSVFIPGLDAGTTYEWRIKTVCDAGEGAFVSGTIFTTTGTTVCYPPTDLSTNVINDTSAVFSWAGPTGAQSYILRYRLINSISWDSVIAPMTLVHCDSITIPDTIGVFTIPFAGLGIDTVTYDGNGLYIAWEYSRSIGALSSVNNALATTANTSIQGINGLDSLTFVLSLVAANDTSATAHRDILFATDLRPETWLGSAGLVDSVEVAVVYALGYHAPSFVDTASISALIKNHSAIAQIYPITLVVKDQGGTVRFTTAQNVMIDGDTSSLVTFDGWVPTFAETDSIIISVPGQGAENVLGNNQNCYLQTVNSSIVAFDDGSDAVTRAGFDTSSGLLLTRYKMDGCGSVNAAQVYLDFSSIGNSLYAVIMDASGTLIDSSNVFVPDSFDVNNYHAFYFPEAPFFSDSEYYVGLAQTANAVEGYFPVGVQWETADIRDSAYYRANIDGTSLINNPNPGRLMIRGEIVPGIIVPEIFGDLSLCISETDTLSVGSKITRFANSVIDVSSEFSTLGFGATRALGSPDLYPDHGTSSNQWIPGTADEQREYIVLGFSNPAPVNFIDIYETLNPGAVDTVYVKNPGSGNFEVVYTNTATVGDTVGTINHITFDTTAFNVSEVRIALNSPAVIGFNGIDAVGIGLESDTSDFTSYLWSTSATSQFIEISTAGTYSVTVTDAAGCVASDSVEVITPSQTPPMISVVDALSTTFCQGDSIILISDQAVGNTWSTSETTQRIVVKTAGSYFVIFDDGTGCGTQQSNTIAVTVNSLPSPTITGTLGICPLGSTTLDAGSFSSYNWSTGETTQTINVLTAGTFFVTVTNANGCVGSSPGVTTSISTPPAPTITGTLAFCPGSSTTLDAGTFTTYLWSTTETTQTINVNTAGTFSVTVTDGNGCTGSSPSVTTSVFTTPVPTISGDLAFCPGDSTTLFAENGFTTYSWSTGDNTQSTVVSAIGSYTVTVTDINGCSGTNSATVGEYAPPAPVITGTLSFCGGSSTELDAGGDFSSYLWSTGETSQKILVDSADTYSVTITDLNGCMADTNATVTIEGSVPPTPGPISGPMTGLCDLMLGEFSISPVTNAQFYFWTLPEGVTVIGPSDSNVIMLQIDSLSTGFLLVEAANACGLSHSTDSALISVQGSPDVPGNISGPDTTACNQTGQSYSIAAVAQASSYTWSVPVGATITGGQGTTSITVDFGSESGNVCVTSNNMCSSSQPSCLPVHIPAFTVDAGDCKFVYPSVSPFNCVDLTATVDGGTAPYTYQWTILGGGVEGTTQTINVCNIVNTNYVIEVTDVNGCSVSDTVEVEVVAAMCAENKVPICHLATGQSLCASASAAQNHLDHGDLLGHCDDLPPCAGLLGAIVSAAQQPSNPAGIIQAADPGEGEDYLRWQMYPNPSLGEVYVDLHELTKDHDVTLEIFDLLSKRVAMQHVGKANHLIRMDLRHLTSGIYTVSLRTQTGFHNAKKLIISGKN